MKTTELKTLLSQKIVAFRREFVDVTGNVSAAIFLSQAFYWQSVVERQEASSGWWWKTRDDWEKETGLSRYQQEQAREKLRDLGVLEERRQGRTGKLCFRLDLEALAKILKTDISRWRKTRPKMGENSPYDGGKLAISSSDDESTSETTEDTLGSADATPSIEPTPSGVPGASSSEDLCPELAEVHAAGLSRTRLTPEEKIEAATRGETRMVVRKGGLAGRRGRVDRNSIQAHNEEAERDRRRAGISGSQARRKPKVSSWRPEKGASFDDWSEWASDKIRARKKDGGGVKSPCDWNGTDAVDYLFGLVEGYLGLRRPMKSAKVRSQGKNIVDQLGGDETKRLIDYVVADWSRIAKKFKLDSTHPTMGILIGYGDTLGNMMDGVSAGALNPSDRGEGDWDEDEDQGGGGW